MLTRKFARKKAHRDHMLRNLAASVILYEKVETTAAKGKEIRALVDRSITLAKKNTLASRRQIESMYFDSNVTKKLFEVLATRFADRPSGFTRILKLGNRFGDNADKVMLLLIEDKKPAQKAEKPAKEVKETESKPEKVEASDAK